MLRKILAFALAAVLLCGAAAALAEDFAFTPIPLNADKSPYEPKKENYLPDNAGFHDDSIDVRIETFRRDDTTVMAAYIKIIHPSQLRTATAAAKYPSSKKAPVASLAKRERAVLAINGDYFTYHKSGGVVIRNGRNIRPRATPGRDILIIDENGDFTILKSTEGHKNKTQKEFQAEYEAFEGTVTQAFCFGPGLVIDGEPLTDLETITLNCGKNRKTQRIVIGQTGPLEYLVLSCEGPENKDSVGFDLLQMAQLCKEMGCINAYNLDGGSSCTIALHYKKINALSSGKVRYTSDAICFDTLVP